MKKIHILSLLFLVSPLIGCGISKHIPQSLDEIRLPWQDKPLLVKADAIPNHKSWCYKTLAQVECYPTPQNFPATTLVNVDPLEDFPLTTEAYKKAIEEAKPKPPEHPKEEPKTKELEAETEKIKANPMENPGKPLKITP